MCRFHVGQIGMPSCGSSPSSPCSDESERRQREIDKAQEAFDAAEREHAKTTATIQADRKAVEGRSQAEDSRWAAEKKRLQAALRRINLRRPPVVREAVGKCRGTTLPRPLGDKFRK